MPNNVRNKLIFNTEEDYLNARELLWTEEEPDGPGVDFNILIPQPEGIYRGNMSKQDHITYPINWYDWNTNNWDTKWNAYDSEDLPDEFAIAFTTAWSPPYPVIVALANKLNTIGLTHAYVCEHTEYWGVEEWYQREKIDVRQDFIESFGLTYGEDYMEEYRKEWEEESMEYEERFSWPPQLADCYKHKEKE
jgi:hypothetical protein